MVSERSRKIERVLEDVLRRHGWSIHHIGDTQAETEVEDDDGGSMSVVINLTEIATQLDVEL